MDIKSLVHETIALAKTMPFGDAVELVAVREMESGQIDSLASLREFRRSAESAWSDSWAPVNERMVRDLRASGGMRGSVARV